MTIGLLLEYLSDIGCGSWAQFKDALVGSRAAPGRPPIFVAQDLAALGHIEVEPDSLRWAVCPATLAELPDEQGTAALLCGARSPAFLSRVVRTAEQLGGGHDPHRFTLEGEVVERLVVKMPNQAALAQLAETVEIPLLLDAARRLAACLPDIQALVEASPPDAPATGTGVEHLLTDDAHLERSSWLSWSQYASARRPGLSRLQLPFRRQYWWVGANGEARRVSKEVGMYSVLHKLLRYDEWQRTMTFPSDARLPDLHLRALVLCSGQLPKDIGMGRLQVDNVTRDIAITVAKRLHQSDLN
jgi:hypothetical protein